MWKGGGGGSWGRGKMEGSKKGLQHPELALLGHSHYVYWLHCSLYPKDSDITTYSSIIVTITLSPLSSEFILCDNSGTYGCDQVTAFAIPSYTSFVPWLVFSAMQREVPGHLYKAACQAVFSGILWVRWAPVMQFRTLLIAKTSEWFKINEY